MGRPGYIMFRNIQSSRDDEHRGCSEINIKMGRMGLVGYEPVFS